MIVLCGMFIVWLLWVSRLMIREGSWDCLFVPLGLAAGLVIVIVS